MNTYNNKVQKGYKDKCYNINTVKKIRSEAPSKAKKRSKKEIKFSKNQRQF